MSFQSKVLYTGNGATKAFNIPFPFISGTHVRVFVNETLQLDPMNYVRSSSTITFGTAPAVDDAIVISRSTSPINTLVDFVDGSVLNESDLDTAYLHNFYLSQEYADSFNDLINKAFIVIASGVGIVETEPDLVIAALVDEMLGDAAAATLQSRITDIDDNAESIIQIGSDMQIQVNTLAQGVAAVVYIQDAEPVPGVGGIPDPILDGARWYDSNDNNASYIYDQSGTEWLSIADPRIGVAVTNITTLQATVITNAAAVVTEQTARADGDGAIATDLALLGAANGGDTAFILDLDTVEVVAGVETLASRFTTITADKDTNAASISTESTTRADADSATASLIALIGAENGASNAFIMDTSTVKIDNDAGETFATRLSGLAATDGVNAANITTEESARISADTAEADLRITLAARVTTSEGDITTANVNISAGVTATTTAQNAANAAQTDADTAQAAADAAQTEADSATGDAGTAQTAADAAQTVADAAQADADTAQTAADAAQGDANTLLAKFGVTLSVGGYITGFAQNNDGSSGVFVVLADKFAVVTPTGTWAASTAYTVGQMRRPTTANSRVFRCSTAGTSGGSEPTWDTQIGNTTNDGTVVWTTHDDVIRTPFLIDGDKIIMNGDVAINGNLILNGSIVGANLANGTIGTTQIGANAITTTELNANSVTANEIAANTITSGHMNITGGLSTITADIGSITAGDITLDSSGFIKGGQSAYDSGNGFWLGNDGGTFKFSIGDGSANSLTWDGTTLSIIGSITHSNSAGDNALLATLNDSSENTASYIKKKTFVIGDAGIIRVFMNAKVIDDVGSVPGVRAGFQAKIGGDTKATVEVTTDGFLPYSADFTVAAGDVVDVYIRGANSTFPTSNSPISTKDVEIRTTKFIDQVTLDIA